MLVWANNGYFYQFFELRGFFVEKVEKKNIKEKVKQAKDQVSFLLKKHNEGLEFCKPVFSELLSFIDQQAQGVSEFSSEYKSLIEIYNIISDQFENFKKEVIEDIGFLEKQLELMKEIEKVEDEKKIEQLFDAALDGETELIESETFMRKIEEDTEESKRNIMVLVEDVKNAVNEGNYDDLIMTLKAMKAADFDHRNGEDGELFGEDEEENVDGSSCTGFCASCQQGCGVDIFAKLDEVSSEKENIDGEKEKNSSEKEVDQTGGENNSV